jgi:signal peptidase I
MGALMATAEKKMPDESAMHNNSSTSAEATTPLSKPLYVRFWHYWKPVIIVLAILLPSRSILVDWNDVPTGSMIPTIQISDRIFVNKLSYGVRVPFTMIWIAQWGEINPGDVITLRSPADGVRLVKRVMGTPGDTLELRNNVVYINGQPLDYQVLDVPPEDLSYTAPDGQHLQVRYLLETIGNHTHKIMLRVHPSPHPDAVKARNYGPVTVPEDSYFLMGDNRDFSSDSRFFNTNPKNPSAGQYVPFVHREKIFGRTKRVLLTFKLSNFMNRLWEPIL